MEKIPKKEELQFTNQSFDDKILEKKLELGKLLNAKTGELTERKTVETLEDYVDYLKNYETTGKKDSLTQLENRRELFNRGVELFDRFENSEKNKTLSVISLDVDFFKVYNEISHTFGDVALQTIGKVLLENTGKDEFGVRLGGEEIFLIVELGQNNLQKKADNIRQLIRKELNKLIDSADEWSQKPKGATRDFLERKALLNPRSAKSINEQVVNLPNYKKSINKIKELGIDLPGKTTPAQTILILKDILKNQGDLYLNEEINKILATIPFEVGSVTVGAVEVTKENEQSVVNSDDLSVIKLNLELKKLPQLELQGLTYNEVYKEIDEKIPDKKFSEILINKIKQNRFGRIVDMTNVVAEKQKEAKRNVSKVEKISLKKIDEQEKSLIPKKTQEAFLEQKRVLEELKQKNKKLVDDDAKDLLDKIKADTTDSEKVEALTESLLILQQERYSDDLTQAYNYEYLVSVVSQELKQSKENNQDYAVVSFDLDNLKAVNETGGHKLGDTVLMAISAKIQEALLNLSKNSVLKKNPVLLEKITNSMIDPALIRVTGGEEFLLTFPGLNSDEAHDVFEAIQKETSEYIKKMLQTADATTGIKKYLTKTLKKQGAEVEKFGTLTAGIVSLSDNLNLEENSGWMNAGKMRQIADEVGERLKKEEYSDKTTGRGHVWEYETYKLVKKADEYLVQLNLEKKENQVLHSLIRTLQEQVKKEKDKTSLKRLRQELEDKIQ